MVRGLVHYHATAFAAPGAAPGGLAVVGGRAGPGGHQVGPLHQAEAPVADQRAGRLHFGTVPHLEADRQHAIGLVGGLNQPVGLGDLDRHRLLDQDVGGRRCRQSIAIGTWEGWGVMTTATSGFVAASAAR